jgi:hypothetical protein
MIGCAAPPRHAPPNRENAKTAWRRLANSPAAVQFPDELRLLNNQSGNECAFELG